jgi:hypothetical protein
LSAMSSSPRLVAGRWPVELRPTGAGVWRWPGWVRAPSQGSDAQAAGRRVAPAAPRGPEQMKAVVTARLRRLQRLPQIVRGFFGDPELAYITAVA